MRQQMPRAACLRPEAGVRECVTERGVREFVLQRQLVQPALQEAGARGDPRRHRVAAHTGERGKVDARERHQPRDAAVGVQLRLRAAKQHQPAGARNTIGSIGQQAGFGAHRAHAHDQIDQARPSPDMAGDGGEQLDLRRVIRAALQQRPQGIDALLERRRVASAGPRPAPIGLDMLCKPDLSGAGGGRAHVSSFAQEARDRAVPQDREARWHDYPPGAVRRE
jgi:hypothetical protein